MFYFLKKKETMMWSDVKVLVFNSVRLKPDIKAHVNVLKITIAGILSLLKAE